MFVIFHIFCYYILIDSFLCVHTNCIVSIYLSMEPGGRIVVGLGSTVSALEALSADRIRAWAFEYVTKMFAELQLTAIVNPTMGKNMCCLCGCVSVSSLSCTTGIVLDNVHN